MKAGVERLARRWWAGELGVFGVVLSVVLTPLTWLWTAVAARRNRRFDRGRATAVDGLTVVSVGNLAVGGTGKTPVASWLAGRLRDGGARPALILRGYGRDEALLHRMWTPDVPVIVDRDRVAGARLARAEGADVAVLDDGFQHRSLDRHLDLVLIAAEDAFPGRVLPCGPYREPPNALARVDAVLVTRRSGTVEDARRVEAAIAAVHPGLVKGAVYLAPDGLVSWDGEPVDAPASEVLAVTAIARPEAFRVAVEETLPGPVELMSYGDHHDYTRADAGRIRRLAGARVIVTTEKDAVKLIEHRDVLGSVHVLRQRLLWDWGEDAIAGLLEAVVAGVKAS